MSALRHCQDLSDDSLFYFYKAGSQYPLFSRVTVDAVAATTTDFLI